MCILCIISFFQQGLHHFYYVLYYCSNLRCFHYHAFNKAGFLLKIQTHNYSNIWSITFIQIRYNSTDTESHISYLIQTRYRPEYILYQSWYTIRILVPQISDTDRYRWLNVIIATYATLTVSYCALQGSQTALQSAIGNRARAFVMLSNVPLPTGCVKIRRTMVEKACHNGIVRGALNAVCLPKSRVERSLRRLATIATAI